MNDVAENSVLALYFQFNSELTLEVDGTACGVFGVVPRVFGIIYPIIDLYGKVLQVIEY